MKGIGVTSGIALGKVLLYEESKITVERYGAHDLNYELDRLDNAIKEALGDIEVLYDNTLKKLGEEEASIFNAHKMMIEDPEFIGSMKSKIRFNKVRAEWAVKEVTDDYKALFEGIENKYLRERVSDLKDISQRLLRNLLGIKKIDLSILEEECIVVARDLTPSDIVQMDKDMVLGIVTELGGSTSHTFIMTKGLDIPAVAGVENIIDAAEDGDMIIVDGDEGLVVLEPSQEEINRYKEKKLEGEKLRSKLNRVKGRESRTRDGRKVGVVANIGNPKDIDRVIKNDGEGVGLFRTEFLYMDNDRLPTEDEQFVAYKLVAESLEGKPVIIRTLDGGGDKDISYLNLPKELNPFLGYRAIRLCLHRRDIFKTQLRALLRASVFGNIKIMFPLISDIKELREAKGVLEEVKDELRKKDTPFNENIELGIMVEVPAVAVHSDMFAKEVDFFSIGTNDLIQYTVAVDRGNQSISYLYNQYHPAVLKLVRMTIENAHREGIRVSLCGEAAEDEKLIPLLLAMELDEFSMSPSSMLKARYIINNTWEKDIKPLLDTILALPTSDDVENFIEENIMR